MLVDASCHDMTVRRASYEVYKRWNVNRFELWLLSSLVGYLNSQGLTVVSKVRFFKEITGNSREYVKYQGYYAGLLKLGLIGTYEYVRAPGSESVGLSDKGVKVIQDYYNSLQQFQERYRSTNRLEISSANPVPTLFKKTA